MATGVVIRKNQYHDSVYLMGVNKRLSASAGVRQSAVLMGTERNKDLLADIGFRDASIDAAGPNDLVVAVMAESQQSVEEALGHLDLALETMVATAPASLWRTFEDALAHKRHANLAVLSIPGEYAAREARKALDAGLNVFVFSSNMGVEEELSLKRNAAQKKLIVMGPDCGTSVIGGVGIGFANVVRRGKIGVIGASGTGLQEFTSQVHIAGLGISHAIGTGTRDVSDAIGGITTLAALEALESDANTEVIALVSKPPGARTLATLLERLQVSPKPVVCCFLGAVGLPAQRDGLSFAATIDEAVLRSVRAAGGEVARTELTLTPGELVWCEQEAARWSAEQRYVRGIFAGGTFCYQAQRIFRDAGLLAYSNAPLDAAYRLADLDQSRGHTLLDMGDEYYTLGRPHPMIDGTLRARRIAHEGLDPQVAVVLVDFVLGYNASPDPVGELLEAIVQSKRAARERGAHLTVVASVCGTERDSQNLDLQSAALREHEVIVFSSSGRAALFCASLVQTREDA